MWPRLSPGHDKSDALGETLEKLNGWRDRPDGTIPECIGDVRGDGLTMLTDSVSSFALNDGLRKASALPAATQKVAIVNGSPDVLALAENVISAGHYDVIFVESVGHAYSHIKRVQPNLIILCLRFDDVETLQVLSMLKLDEDTRRIPVLTFTVDESSTEEEDDEEADPADMRVFAIEPGLRMN